MLFFANLCAIAENIEQESIVLEVSLEELNLPDEQFDNNVLGYENSEVIPLRGTVVNTYKESPVLNENFIELDDDVDLSYRQKIQGYLKGEKARDTLLLGMWTKHLFLIQALNILKPIN
ncbi:MAG: hypothetical protein MZU97_02790 [Bacillus subtilis]|nr:hypothetical protein [Bacillus subtilis]